MKILTVFGTRPEAIKMAPLVQQLEKEPGLECGCVAQHEMLDQAGLFEVVPDYDLMSERTGVSQITTLLSMEKVLQVQPNIVWFTATTTTFSQPGGVLPENSSGPCGSGLGHTINIRLTRKR